MSYIIIRDLQQIKYITYEHFLSDKTAFFHKNSMKSSKNTTFWRASCNKSRSFLLSLTVLVNNMKYLFEETTTRSQ